MAVYSWHDPKTGKLSTDSFLSHVEMREEDGQWAALIYPPNYDDPKAQQELGALLQSQGLTLAPTKIPPKPDHSLVITGDAKGLAAFERDFKKTYYGQQFDVELKGDRLEINGIDHQFKVDAIRRWAEGAKNPIDSAHGYHIEHINNSEGKPPRSALHVTGIKNEQHFLGVLESRWAKGERHDQYYGMSRVQKTWTQIKSRAMKWAAFFYMLGEGQVFLSLKEDADRRDISVWKHEGIMEPFGYLAGSSNMYVSALLNEPTSEAEVARGFLAGFRVGDGYDFDGKTEGFHPEGAFFGRSVDMLKGSIKENGTEILMLLNTMAGVGVYKGRFNEIMDAPERDDGTRHVRLNEEGKAAGTRRFKFKDAWSGIVLTVGTLMYTFLPSYENDDPFVRYDAIRDKLYNTPVVGQAMRFLEGFKHTAAFQVLSFVPDKVVNWLRRDPERIASRMFQSHNVAQIVFGAQNVLEVSREIDHLDAQLKDDLERLRKNEGNPKDILGYPYGEEGFKNIELEDIRTKLEGILNPEDTTSYLKYIKTYEEKLSGGAARGDVITDEDRFLAVKSYTRKFLEELKQEKTSFKWKLSGNLTNFTAGMMLAETGHSGAVESGVLEKQVNPFSVAQLIVDELKQANALTEKAITNAAAYLHQDERLKPYGLGNEEYRAILQAYAEGRVPDAAVREMAMWGVTAPSGASQVPGSDTLSKWREISHPAQAVEKEIHSGGRETLHTTSRAMQYGPAAGMPEQSVDLSDVSQSMAQEMVTVK